MPLHPQVVKLMNIIAELNIPAVWEISPEESRGLVKKRRELIQGDFIPVGNVYDRTILAPQARYLCAFMCQTPMERPAF